MNNEFPFGPPRPGAAAMVTFVLALSVTTLAFGQPADPQPTTTSLEAQGDDDAAALKARTADDAAPEGAAEQGDAGQGDAGQADAAEPVEPTPAAAGQGADGADATATKQAVTGPAKKEDKPKRFIEGELANVGATGLTPWKNRFGITFGLVRLGEVFYGEVRPEINYTTPIMERELTMSFAAPLRVEVHDTRAGRKWNNAGTIRKEDWDEVSDFSRILRYINYGGKEQHFYLDINQFKASSIAHGTILKRYNPNLNLNTRYVSASFDAFIDYGGFETFINDVTGPNVMGALAFIKPLSIFNRKNYFLRSFSIGATFVADIDAPLRNKLDTEDADDDGRWETELLVNQDTFQPEYVSTEVLGYGLDLEFKVIDTENVDWKLYFDYSELASGIPTDEPGSVNVVNIPTKAVRSGGATAGGLIRLNLGGSDGGVVHALRLRGEYRNYDHNYLPSYFDTFYEIQRIQYLQAGQSNADLSNRTKLQAVLGRDPSAPRVQGGYLEASWRASHYIALAMALEFNDSTADNNMFVHLEVPQIGRWQFLATYHRRTRESLTDIFSAKFDDNDIFIVKTRWGLSDNFFMNFEALTPFGIGPDSFFRNTVEVNVTAEFGFSYGRGS